MSDHPTLRERCKAFLIKERQDAMLRQRDPVTSLMEFVNFVVAAHAAVPALLDALEATTAERDVLRAALKKLRGYVSNMLVPWPTMREIEAALKETEPKKAESI